MAPNIEVSWGQRRGAAPDVRLAEDFDRDRDDEDHHYAAD